MKIAEAWAGIEPADGGFADRSVTTSPPGQRCQFYHAYDLKLTMLQLQMIISINMEGGRYLTQLRLFRLREMEDFDLLGVPTRNLHQVVTEDSLEIMDLIGQIYVPKYDGGVIEELKEILGWYYQQMEQHRTRESPVSETVVIPNFPEHHGIKLGAFFDVIEDLESDTSLRGAGLVVPAGYSPSSSDLKRDIKIQTWVYMDNLRKYAVDIDPRQYGRKHVMSSASGSTSLMVLRVNQFYMSNGEDYRDQAIDMILGRMFFYYWLRVKMRAQKLASILYPR